MREGGRREGWGDVVHTPPCPVSASRGDGSGLSRPLTGWPGTS